MNRKIRRFWREWGLTLEECIGLLGAFALVAGIVAMPILLDLIGALFF